jgi:hypothetical protein
LPRLLNSARQVDTRKGNIACPIQRSL